MNATLPAHSASICGCHCPMCNVPGDQHHCGWCGHVAAHSSPASYRVAPRTFDSSHPFAPTPDLADLSLDMLRIEFEKVSRDLAFERADANKAMERQFVLHNEFHRRGQLPRGTWGMR